MNDVCFLLSHPQNSHFRHHRYPFDIVTDTLLFEHVRIDKSTGDIYIAGEESNGLQGRKFATFWETVNVSDEKFTHNSVQIHEYTDELSSAMEKWNVLNPQEQWTTQVGVCHSLGLNVHVYASPELINGLQQLDWGRYMVKLHVRTKRSLSGLEVAFSEDDKNALREGRYHLVKTEGNRIVIEIEECRMAVENLPVPLTAKSVVSSPLRGMSHLARFFGGH